jgi:hypothetical protein
MRNHCQDEGKTQGEIPPAMASKHIDGNLKNYQGVMQKIKVIPKWRSSQGRASSSVVGMMLGKSDAEGRGLASSRDAVNL